MSFFSDQTRPLAASSSSTTVASGRRFSLSGDFRKQEDLVFPPTSYITIPRNCTISDGLAPIGCVPLQMTTKFTDPMARTCVPDENSDAHAYNSKL
ncbi:hypothetical protein HHK36_022727 [Tetracentron sinense]|uniref:Uncharacterized protein n=1 Tax=Tetracentron sinense TaxID=13715 RepID=A0A834YSH3_TETSI|nr:hypothetical protein HHK36_022727 [Tetracentron sinense]